MGDSPEIERRPGMARRQVLAYSTVDALQKLDHSPEFYRALEAGLGLSDDDDDFEYPNDDVPGVEVYRAGNSSTEVYSAKPAEVSAEYSPEFYRALEAGLGLSDDGVFEYPYDVHHGETLQADDSNTEVYSANPENRRQAGHLVRRLGHFAIGAAVAVSSLFGFSEFSERPNQPKIVTLDQTNPTEPAEQETTTTTSTTEATTTTQQEVYPTFEARNGERIGVLKIPKICEEIDVIQTSEQEKIDNLIGTGQATLDRKVKDPTPNDGCESIDEWERKHGVDIKDRTEWKYRASATSPENPEGEVNFWQPTATFDVHPSGGLISQYPGAIGDTLISGHGSTFSAPFAALVALEPGDEAIFVRADGVSLTYRVIESEVVYPHEWDKLLNPDIEIESMITLYMCTDKNRNPGSADRRTAVRLALV